MIATTGNMAMKKFRAMICIGSRRHAGVQVHEHGDQEHRHQAEELAHLVADVAVILCQM